MFWKFWISLAHPIGTWLHVKFHWGDVDRVKKQSLVSSDSLPSYFNIALKVWLCQRSFVFHVAWQYYTPSVHPSIFCRLSSVWSWWQWSPDNHLPSYAHQLLLGNPKVFPGQERYIIPPTCSGPAPESPPNWTCPEYLWMEASRSYPDQVPNLSWLVSMCYSGQIKF